MLVVPSPKSQSHDVELGMVIGVNFTSRGAVPIRVSATKSTSYILGIVSTLI